MMNNKEKTAFITGASRGIGKAIKEVFETDIKPFVRQEANWNFLPKSQWPTIAKSIKTMSLT